MFHIIIEINCMPQKQSSKEQTKEMQQQTDLHQTDLQQTNSQQTQQHIDFMNYSRSIYEVRQMLLKGQEREHNMLEI
ncbi:hypothetical protein [Hungatella effluvii]|uniref:hypothetical protein n=1 Tax=Hungatella effluvii TaxID=1096246 RepID=UPI0022E1B5D5|nr:hypothetical protein [Hungatella effluvii]